MFGLDHILLNIPHSSIGGIYNAGWTNYEALVKDVVYLTDWHTDWLFDQGHLNVLAVMSKYSRFVVDCERLTEDPMESVGQGIIYTAYNGNTRRITDDDRITLMAYYTQYIDMLRKSITEGTLLIDCHSFPSDKADVDICIGLNDDWSRPHENVLGAVCSIFNADGYTVEINHPYANSIAPAVNGLIYPSLMIEANKRIYMDERTLRLKPEAVMLRKTISNIYSTLLK